MSWVDDFDLGHDAMPEEPTMRGYGDAAFDAPAEDARGSDMPAKCAGCGGWRGNGKEHWKCEGGSANAK